MKEIDDRGPEFAAADEPVKGRKHYKKRAAGLAARALLAAAVAGLLTLSVLTSPEEIRTPALYGGDPGNAAPPAVEAPDPEPPEAPEEPESPPPTTPPPTTPPPTTPPPTTPPPTTPPPYIPPYDPPADTFTKPSLTSYSAQGVFHPADGVDVDLYYVLDIGSAKSVLVSWSCTIPGWGEYPCDPPEAFTSSTSAEDSVFCPQIEGVDSTTPPPSARQGTITMTLTYNPGGKDTYTFSFPIQFP